MRTLGVVVNPPAGDLLAGVAQGTEPVQVQALVSELAPGSSPGQAVEALHEGILDRLARFDEPQTNAGPF